MIVTNAFSLNMLAREGMGYSVNMTPLSLTEAQASVIMEAPLVSYVGHQDTANVFSEMLGVEVPLNRGTLTVKPGDKLLIGQYTGPRLPDGTTRLPEGAAINWWAVVICGRS